MNLKILTWNIAFGYGKGSEGGPHYRKKSRTYFEDRLNKIGDFIQTLNIDIALLQEVDFASARSHFIDQLDWISRRSGLFHRQKLVSWDHPFVPYPGLNPMHFFGRVVSGGGIVSRFPLEEKLNVLLPKPGENSKLYNFFYLNRYLQTVQVKTQIPFDLCNLHLEAFSEGNRKHHLEILKDTFLEHHLQFAAGDFNGPAELNFQNSNHGGRLVVQMSPEPSYPCNDPSQYLDGAIYNSQAVRLIKAQTLHTGVLSDHFPVLFEIEVLA